MKNLLLKLLKTSLCLIGLLYVFAHAFYLLSSVYATIDSWDIQIYLYFISATLLIIILLILPFLKVNKWIFILILLLAFSFMYYPLISPSIENEHAKISCEEDGICKEGIVIKHKQKEIIINKQSCIENNWTWDEKNKTCIQY